MKYAKLNLKDYQSLSEAISRAKGYPDYSGTIRYAPVEPIMDKEGNCVMEITPDVQEQFPKIIEGIELTDTYVPTDNNL